MREQIAALDAEGLLEFVRKTKFTAEQRKLLLKELGDVERDPQSTTREIFSAMEARAVIKKTEPVAAPIPAKPKEVMEEDKKKNHSFFEIPNFF